MALYNTITLIRLKITSFINNKSSTNTVEANDKNYKSNGSLKRCLELSLNYGYCYEKGSQLLKEV